VPAGQDLIAVPDPAGVQRVVEHPADARLSEPVAVAATDALGQEHGCDPSLTDSAAGRFVDAEHDRPLSRIGYETALAVPLAVRPLASVGRSCSSAGRSSPC